MTPLRGSNSADVDRLNLAYVDGSIGRCQFTDVAEIEFSNVAEIEVSNLEEIEFSSVAEIESRGRT